MQLDNEFFEAVERGEVAADPTVPKPPPPPPLPLPTWWAQLEAMSDEEVCQRLTALDAMPAEASRLRGPARTADPSAIVPHVGQSARDPSRLLELAKWMKVHGRHMSIPAASIDPELTEALTSLVDMLKREGEIELDSLARGFKFVGLKSTAAYVKARRGDGSKAGSQPGRLPVDEVMKWMAEAVLEDQAEPDHEGRVHCLGSATKFATALAVRREVAEAIEDSDKRAPAPTGPHGGRGQPVNSSVFRRLSVARRASSIFVDMGQQVEPPAHAWCRARGHTSAVAVPMYRGSPPLPSIPPVHLGPVAP